MTATFTVSGTKTKVIFEYEDLTAKVQEVKCVSRYGKLIQERQSSESSKRSRS